MLPEILCTKVLSTSIINNDTHSIGYDDHRTSTSNTNNKSTVLPNLDTIVPATSTIQAAMSIQMLVPKWDTIKHTMLMMAQIVIEVPKHNRTVLNWLALHKSSKKWYMYHYRY